MAHHQKMDALARENQIRVLFLGDSLTDGWDGPNGLSVWEKRIVPLNVANLGVGANRIEHVLWQVNDGGLGTAYRPKVIVLMIGVNNFFKVNSVIDIEEGMKNLVSAIRKRSPESKLLILGVLPSGAEADTPKRRKIAEINGRYAKLADNAAVHFLDIGGKFLSPDGRQLPGAFSDGTHLQSAGYEIFADALLPKVMELLGE